jgi:hypothetical protein
MKTTIFSFVVVAFIMLTSVSSFGTNLSNEPGKSAPLTGKVVDQRTGESLVGAMVTIKGTNLKVYTDLDGNFVIPNMTPGTYTIEVAYVSYQNTELSNVNVTTGMPSALIIKVTSK